MSEFMFEIAEAAAQENAGGGAAAPGDTSTIQDATGGGAGSGAPAARPQAGMMDFLIPMVLMIGVFYFIMWRGNKKERQKHADMLNAIKRNDRVHTIGGIIGTVVDTRDNEVIVKIDETNNVKVRFSRGAIKEVLGESASG